MIYLVTTSPTWHVEFVRICFYTSHPYWCAYNSLVSYHWKALFYWAEWKVFLLFCCCVWVLKIQSKRIFLLGRSENVFLLCCYVFVSKFPAWEEIFAHLTCEVSSPYFTWGLQSALEFLECVMECLQISIWLAVQRKARHTQLRIIVLIHSFLKRLRQKLLGKDNKCSSTTAFIEYEKQLHDKAHETQPVEKAVSV